MKNLSRIATLIAILFSLCLFGCANNSEWYSFNDPGAHRNYHKKHHTRKVHPGRNIQRSKGGESQSMQAEVFRLVNRERSHMGLPPLMSMPVLKDIAQARAREITRRFDHTRPNGESWECILSEYGVRWRACGENIAMGQNSPAAVMHSWLNSTGHRANILGRQYTHIGIGVARDQHGQLCWTQNFIKPR